jgi:tetratricopeptide (TPR) repeat protein
LAKAMEQDHVTQTGGIVGTLRYIAPEQFYGQPDARSDIYALGLTLYELLTLQPAFEDANRNSLIRKITHNELIRPRKLNPRIPRDLETIVLKAIAREPADRYQTAGELARDLECFLEDRPIRARRASVFERLWRWSRRNRIMSGLAASTLVLLVLVAVVASVGYVRTAKQQKRAEDTSALALEALDNIFQQFAPDRISSASTLTLVGDTGEEVTVPVQPVLSKETAVLLEHMLAFYDRLAAQGGDDARLRRKVAEANRRVGDIRQRLGQHEESKAAYLRAIELYGQLVPASGEDADLRTAIARIHNELGNVYWATNEVEAGHASYLEALATLTSRRAESPAAPQFQYELARTHYLLGKWPGWSAGPPPPLFGGPRGPGPGPSGAAQGALGPPPGPRGPDAGQAGPPHDPPGPASGPHAPPPGPRPPAPFISLHEKEHSLQEAIDLLERLVAEHPAVPDYRHLLALCYREVFPRWFGRGPDSSSDAANKATKMLQELVQEYPDVPDYRYDLCQTYTMLNARRAFSPGGADPSQRETLDKALAISEELVAEHPNVPDYAVSQVHIRLSLAAILGKSDPTDAEACLRKALALQSALVRRFPRTSSYKFSMAIICDSLAGFLQERGRLPEARAMLQASIAALKEFLKNDPRAGPFRGVLAHHYMILADLLRRMGEQEAAAEAVRQARDLHPGR